MNVRHRMLAILGAALVCMTFAGVAYAAQVDVTLDPNATGCLDSLPVFTEVNALCSVFSPEGGQATCRLRNDTLGRRAAGPTVGPVVAFNLRQSTSPELFPPPGSTSGHVFRVCANNNVAGQRIKVQLIINGF